MVIVRPRRRRAHRWRAEDGRYLYELYIDLACRQL